MAQFTTGQPVRREVGAIKTINEATTAQGGPGFKRDARSELFMTAVTHLQGKDTFYESADVRTQRFVALVREVALTDPMWLANFIPWLRDEAGIRTATVVAAVEYAISDTDCHKVSTNGVIKCHVHADDAVCQRTGWGRGVPAREVVGGSFQRADEPAEALGYYLGRYGRRLPKGLKKGLSDSAIRLYDQMTVLKYDSSRHTVRPSDVIAMTHPKPKDDLQDAVFTALHDRRHGRKHRAETLSRLPLVLDDSLGVSATWERASGEGGKANWDELIPRMGAFALLRNLRNFDRDGISNQSVAEVKRRLSDPEQIRRARLFPLRFLSAWGALESMRWGETLEAGLQASLQNVPELSGHTLILWDCSGSMRAGYRTGNEERNALWVQAGVFSLALAQRAERATVVPYSNDGYSFPINKGASILREIEKVKNVSGLWGGTKTWAVCNTVLRTDPSIDRVVVVTDEQVGTHGWSMTSRVDFDALLEHRRAYVLNVAGYEIASVPSDRVVAFAGFNDRAFIGIQQAEAGMKGQWPWLDSDH